MDIKFSSVVLAILAVFIVKISIENFNSAQAKDPGRSITTSDSIKR